MGNFLKKKFENKFFEKNFLKNFLEKNFWKKNFWKIFWKKNFEKKFLKKKIFFKIFFSVENLALSWEYPYSCFQAISKQFQEKY